MIWLECFTVQRSFNPSENVDTKWLLVVAVVVAIHNSIIDSNQFSIANIIDQLVSNVHLRLRRQIKSN